MEEKFSSKNFNEDFKEVYSEQKRLERIAKRFGNSMTILDWENSEMHLKQLDLLPQGIIETMKEKGLSIVLGSGSVWEMKHQTPGLKYRFDDIKAKIRSLFSAKWRENYQTEAAGYYEPSLKTAFIGDLMEGESVALHEYGHGVGDLLYADKQKLDEHPYLRKVYKLISSELSPDVLELGDVIATKETFANAFSDYFTLSKKQFISLWRIDNLHDFIRKIVTDNS